MKKNFQHGSSVKCLIGLKYLKSYPTYFEEVTLPSLSFHIWTVLFSYLKDIISYGFHVSVYPIFVLVKPKRYNRMTMWRTYGIECVVPIY